MKTSKQRNYWLKLPKSREVFSLSNKIATRIYYIRLTLDLLSQLTELDKCLPNGPIIRKILFSVICFDNCR